MSPMYAVSDACPSPSVMSPLTVHPSSSFSNGIELVISTSVSGSLSTINPPPVTSSFLSHVAVALSSV